MVASHVTGRLEISVLGPCHGKFGCAPDAEKLYWEVEGLGGQVKKEMGKEVKREEEEAKCPRCGDKNVARKKEEFWLKSKLAYNWYCFGCEQKFGD